MGKRKERGSILGVVLVWMIAFLMIASAWASFAHYVFKAAVSHKAQDQAFHLAEGCIDQVVSWLDAEYFTETELSGAYIVMQSEVGVCELDNMLAGMTSTGYVGGWCKKLAGGVGSFEGVLGKFFYKSSVSQVPLNPCPTPPPPQMNISGPAVLDSFSASRGMAIDDANPYYNLDIGDGWSCSGDRTMSNGGEAWLNGNGSSCLADSPSLTASNYDVTIRPLTDEVTYHLFVRDGAYEAVWNSGTGGDGIYKNDGTKIASLSQTPPEGSYVTLKVENDEMSLWVNGIQWAGGVDTDPIINNGKAGFGLGNTGNSGAGGFNNTDFGSMGTGHVDDFLVR